MAAPRRPEGRGVIEEGIYGAVMTDADLKEAWSIYGPLLLIFLYETKILQFYYFRIPGRQGKWGDRRRPYMEMRLLVQETRATGWRRHG